MRGWVHTLLIVVLAMGVGGCRSPLSHAVDRDSLGPEYTLVKLPTVPAPSGNEGCGAQALAVALGKFDAALDVQQVCDSLPWHEKGATVVDLVAAARSRGYAVSIKKGTLASLRESVAANHAVLVLLDVQTEIWSVLGWLPTRPRMHWGVVGGLSERHIVLEGRGASYRVDTALFDARWERSARCAVVVEGKMNQRGAGTAPP
jgi:ABC-type bacteriocin/lantibiotic exporter with double-glycine peptidase domain